MDYFLQEDARFNKASTAASTNIWISVLVILRRGYSYGHLAPFLGAAFDGEFRATQAFNRHQERDVDDRHYAQSGLISRTSKAI
jgi:hypothetical protein